MIADSVVVDAVIHPYDLAARNQVPSAQQQLDAVYAAHRMASDEVPRPWSAQRAGAGPLPA